MLLQDGGLQTPCAGTISWRCLRGGPLRPGRRICSARSSDSQSRLREMIVEARNDAARAGVTFIPILSYPVDWAI
ncbi:MAG: hypothetical protein M3Y33_20860 [Actinomycetota bacterium]|nr:hypothetical protein [Actinomycetota bacterium]